MKTPSVTISISVYNDSQTIRELVDDLYHSGITGQNVHYLLIDDGSTDNSVETIKELSTNYPNIDYIIHEKNLGFGPTITDAVTIPKTDYIIYMPGDYQFRSDTAKLLLNCIPENPDYVLGVRTKRKDNLYRKILSFVYNRLIGTLIKDKVQDINSVFLVKSKVIEKLRLKSQSAFIHAELYIKIQRAGFKCKSIAIPHHSRKSGQGSGGKVNIIIPTLKELIIFIENLKRL